MNATTTETQLPPQHLSPADRAWLAIIAASVAAAPAAERMLADRVAGRIAWHVRAAAEKVAA